MKNSKITFRGKLWRYHGPNGWYFITLPKNLSKKIRKKYGGDEKGWGRLKTVARIGKTEWHTSIWFDTKANSYLLPIKALTRKTEKIKSGDNVSVNVYFTDEAKAPFRSDQKK